MVEGYVLGWENQLQLICAVSILTSDWIDKTRIDDAEFFKVKVTLKKQAN